ncbi:MAG: LptA/OstA family protein [Cyanobacteriota bacterium]|nr:LptA/OstA family protein [Cyanobacteriota bacterium]
MNRKSGKARYRGSLSGWGLGISILMGWGVSDWQPVVAQPSRAISITADSQEANANTGVIIAVGNVSISYPAEQVTAKAQKAIYYTQEQRIELEGQVVITQKQNRLQAEKITYQVREGTIQALPSAGQQVETLYILPDPTPSPLP